MNISTMSFNDCIEDINNLTFQQTILESEQTDERAMLNMAHIRLNGALARLILTV
jgi:hypothetical protein